MAVAEGFRLGKRVLPDDDWHHEVQEVQRQRKQAAAGKPRPDPMSSMQFDLEAFSHWQCQELQLQPSAGTVWRHQDEVTCSMRLILVDWLTEVCEHLRQQREVIFLAVNFLDRFLSCSRVARAEFQLLGIACLWVAAKYEAVHPPPAKLLIKMANSIYRLPQLLEMEGKLLSALGFRLGAPTPPRFLEYYIQQAGPVSASVRLATEQFLDMAVMVYPYSLATPPATPPKPQSGFHEQAWAAEATEDRSQDEDATLHAISLQRAGSCCSTTSTEVSYPATCFQAACPSDPDEVEDAGSLPLASQESPLRPAAPGRPAAAAVVAARGGGAGTPSKATGFPQGRQEEDLELDFLLVATALPSQLAAAALCAAMEAHQMRAQELLLGMAKLAVCDALSIWKLSQALIQLKTALPSMAAPLCCTFVKRHRDARMRLRQAIGMTIDLTGNQE